MNICSTHIIIREMNVLKGITQVIDELGLIILNKNLELDDKQKEIDSLKQKIEMIECYIDALESYTDAPDGRKNDYTRNFK